MVYHKIKVIYFSEFLLIDSSVIKRYLIADYNF